MSCKSLHYIGSYKKSIHGSNHDGISSTVTAQCFQSGDVYVKKYRWQIFDTYIDIYIYLQQSLGMGWLLAFATVLLVVAMAEAASDEVAMAEAASDEEDAQDQRVVSFYFAMEV